MTNLEFLRTIRQLASDATGITGSLVDDLNQLVSDYIEERYPANGPSDPFDEVILMGSLARMAVIQGLLVTNLPSLDPTNRDAYVLEVFLAFDEDGDFGIAYPKEGDVVPLVYAIK